MPKQPFFDLYLLFSSYFTLFFHYSLIAAAILPLFSMETSVKRLYPKHMNVAFTRVLLIIVTNTWPPWNILFMTE